MTYQKQQTPILFCVFNRPELTRAVFAAIRQARPQRLLLVADGPRADHPYDATLVEQTRQIVRDVDWDCQVQTNFSDTNMGCRQRMASGLDWAFSLEERLIVLEDDCLPGPAFFDYCQQMLDQFQTDPRVGMICGDQFLQQPECETDAYFSRYPFVWGWASWRRAWQHYDLKMTRWPSRAAENWLEEHTSDSAEAVYWEQIFQQQQRGQIDTWDYSWIFNCWDQEMLSVHPRENLVSNLGFGADATHTTDEDSRLANLPIPKRPPANGWTLPGNVKADAALDSRIFHEVYKPAEPEVVVRPNWFQRRWDRLSQWLRAG